MKINTLYKQHKFHDILDLLSINVKIDKAGNKPIINRIYLQDNVILSINAYYWKIDAYTEYQKIKTSVCLNLKQLPKYNINKLLIYKLYEEVIKTVL